MWYNGHGNIGIRNCDRGGLVMRISLPMRHNIERPMLVVCVLIMGLFLTSCNAYEDKILNSLGEYEKHVYFSEGEFQDFTDYAKYYYVSTNIDGNTYFTKIQDFDLNKINEHLDDFEGWIETIKDGDSSCEIVINYDFNRDIIDEEDYIYIYSETQTWDDGHTSLVNYDIYFLDIQTLVLYYFHNNI